MNGRAYYNDNDRFACDWLERLIARGLIPSGDVDRRSIVDVRPADLVGYSQLHFFAGVGGWPLAARYAGWPDTWPIATGSCPCQPVSGAGKRRGHADERHVWPAFYGLIEECGFPIVFGEQVASADGREWFAAVRADLEGLGYAVGAADLCAAGVGAPHIRQRIYWVADAGRGSGESERSLVGGSSSDHGGEARQQRLRADSGPSGDVGGMADAGVERQRSWIGHLRATRGQPDAGRLGAAGSLADAGVSGPARLGQHGGTGSGAQRLRSGPADGRGPGVMGDAAGARFQERQDGPRDLHGPQGQTAERAGEDARALADANGGRSDPQRQGEISPPDFRPEQGRGIVRSGGHSDAGPLADAEGLDRRLPARPDGRGDADPRRRGEARWSRAPDNPWRAPDWLFCRDGKWRPVEPGTFPLAHGVSGRVGRLRAYGNPINPYLGAEFIQAYLETKGVIING